MKFEIKWKRAYEKIGEADGFRILVDKLWPRGLKKEDAKIDYWAKIITPSKELLEELKKGNVTMVYASRTPELSHVPVLKEFIEEKLGK